MKIFPVNKIQGPDGLTGKFYEPLREMLTQEFLKLFQNTTVVGKPANSSYEYSITLVSKLKITQKRKIIHQYLCMQVWWLCSTGVVHAQGQPKGVTHIQGQDPRLPHVQGEEQRPRGATPRPRSGMLAVGR